MAVCGTGTHRPPGRSFLGGVGSAGSPGVAPRLLSPLTLTGYRGERPVSNRGALPTLPRPPPLHRGVGGAGILTSSPSPTPCGLGLGPTDPPPNNGAEEPLGFRRAGFSPALALLVPGFALPCPPAVLPHHLQRAGDALLPRIPAVQGYARGFGGRLSPDTFSAQDPSIGELLRTL